MRALRTLALVAALQLAAGPAGAGPVNIAVSSDGQAVANAVVELVATGVVASDAIAALPASATVDQTNLTFFPLVTILRRGGQVVFANSDNTRHQVYSFSAVKRFDIQVNQASKSPPIAFDQIGVAAIGCNIHDNMVAFVYVTENRLTAVTGTDGQARFAVVPAGNYRVQVWHSRLPPRSNRPELAIDVGAGPFSAPLSIALLSDPRAGAHNSHKQSY